jgi:hypothetical protein
MREQLPYWLQVLQALSTPAIALLAITIGGMQWRTSHQRAVLDLFDKRWAVLNELRSVISDIVREGSVTTQGALSYAIAVDRAKFLFGREVVEYLETIRMALSLHHVAEQQLRAEPPEETRNKLIDQEADAMMEISEFYRRINLLVRPYMRMHQKVPWF